MGCITLVGYIRKKSFGENGKKNRIRIQTGTVLCCISTCVDISQERIQFPIEQKYLI